MNSYDIVYSVKRGGIVLAMIITIEARSERRAAAIALNSLAKMTAKDGCLRKPMIVGLAGSLDEVVQETNRELGNPRQTVLNV